MAPKRPIRTRKSASSTTTNSTRPSDPFGSFPAPPPMTAAASFVDSAYGSQSQQSHSQPQKVPLKSPTQQRTPIRKRTSHANATSQISVAQRQALIDNLRVEITERARKLRAQYTLQCTSLRQRLELRIHRVPLSLRNLTMGEVISRHQAKLAAEAEAKAQKVREAKEAERAREDAEARAKVDAERREQQRKEAENRPAKAQTRGKKRSSDVATLDEKENAPALPNKRARTAAVALSSTTTTTKAKPNTTARRAPPSTAANREVLSPKSGNARNPTSPFKSPTKPVSRPTSPLKPSVVSPSKPPTVPRDVPAVAGMGTASSMAKTRGTKGTNTTTTTGASTKPGPKVGARTASRTAGTKKPAKTVAKKTAIHVDEELPARQTRNSAKRGSGASDGTNASGGTVIVKKPAAKPTVRAAVGAAVGSIKGKREVAKKTGTVGKGAATGTGTVRGGRTLRTRG